MNAIEFNSQPLEDKALVLAEHGIYVGHNLTEACRNALYRVMNFYVLVVISRGVHHIQEMKAMDQVPAEELSAFHA